MGHSHSHGSVSGRKLFLTIIFNVIITAAEFVGGIMSGYLALLADAVHNLSDVAALILAWLGTKGAQLPATKRSTYGYKRFEVMTAFISAVSLVVIGVFIVLEAIDKLRSPEPITHPTLFLSIAVIGLIGNVLSVWYLSSERGKSLNMKAAFLHMSYDAISSVAVIAGGIVIILYGWIWIDAVLSIMIAGMILYSSYSVIREATYIFMESAPEGIEYDSVRGAILSVIPVYDVHDLHIWSLSSHEIALSCHVCVDESDYQNGPEIMRSIGEMLHDKFEIEHATLQLEKGACSHPYLACDPVGHDETSDE